MIHFTQSPAKRAYLSSLGIGSELRQVELYGAGEIKAKWGLPLGEIAMTNDMFLIVQGAPAASYFGSCNFVKHWLGKVEKECAHLGVEMCDQCQGLFSSDSSLLSQIKVGAQDKMQRTILQVYLVGEDYRIYRTRQGVYVNFADCRLRERKQRKNYAEVCDRLCNLRFLTGQIARWPSFIHNWLQRSGGFYDHQIAEAIHLALQENVDDANKILDRGLKLAENRLTNENRVRYLFSCLLVALIPAVLLWWQYPRGSTPPSGSWSLFLAAGAGALGAVFSIGMRILDLDLHPCQQTVMNYIMGGLRVLIGFTAGALILLLVAHTVIGKGIISLFESASITDWHSIVLLGFLGGFAERLVPLLLGKLERGAGAESKSTTSKPRVSLAEGRPA